MASAAALPIAPTGASLAASAAAVAGGAAAVGGLAAANGGFFPGSWGWAILGFGWAAALALTLSTVRRLGRLECAYLGALGALAGWYFLSTMWSSSVPSSVFEAERALVYPAAAAAALLVVRRNSLPQFLGGMLLGITVVDLYAIGTRLLPDRLGSYDPVATYRLAAPVGYWNGLGILSVMGAFLGLALAARAHGLLTRALSAFPLPLFAATLYFTFSRGALIALAVAFLVVIVLDANRLQLASTTTLIAVPAAFAAWTASQTESLRTRGAATPAVVHAGHRYALILIVLCFCSLVAAFVCAVISARITVPRRVRVAAGAALVGAAAVAAAVVLIHFGGPAEMVSRGWHSFTGPPVSVSSTGGNLNKRLLSLSSNGRIDLWRGALHEVRAHPVLGGGAGSYEHWWNAHRPLTLDVLDAHSLYLETLAELGPIGLLLLIVALALPVAAAVTARKQRFVPIVCGAYIAYVIHAAADWDWELSGVTVTAVLCGSALLVAARREASHVDLPSRVRGPALATLVAMLGVAVVVTVGNAELGSASNALRSGNWARAESKARAAKTWMPWASAPWRTIGESQLARRQFADARASLGKAIAKDPQDWHLWLDLAAASKGNASARALARARTLNPRSLDIASLG